jgi:carboxypeptidase PM20D1
VPSKKRIGLVAGAGLGAAAAVALRRRWGARGSGGGEMKPLAPGPLGAALLDHLAEAVQIRTVGGSGFSAAAFDEFHALLRRTYPLTHERLVWETVGGHSLLYCWSGTRGEAAPVLLVAHMDVVPVEPGTQEDWEHPPFSGARSGGYLWGRGSLDAKGPLIAIFEAVESLLAEGFEPEPSVYISIGHDEETGGSGGAAEVAELLAARGVRFGLVLDEGGVVGEGLFAGAAGPIALLGIGEKGYLDVELSVMGHGGHSALAPAGTVIGRLAAAVARLEEHPMPVRTEIQRDFFAAVYPRARALAQHGAGLLGVLSGRRRQPTLLSDALVRTTGAATIIEGGIEPNVLPQRARAVVNFRVLPGDTAEDVLTHVRSVVGDDVRVAEIAGAGCGDAPPLSDPRSASFRMVADIIDDVFPGVVVAPWIVMGTTDSRYFTPIADAIYRFVPFRVSAADLGRIHGTGERIRISDADGAVAFYRRFLARATGSV